MASKKRERNALDVRAMQPRQQRPRGGGGGSMAAAMASIRQGLLALESLGNRQGRGSGKAGEVARAQAMQSIQKFIDELADERKREEDLKKAMRLEEFRSRLRERSEVAREQRAHEWAGSPSRMQSIRQAEEVQAAVARREAMAAEERAKEAKEFWTNVAEGTKQLTAQFTQAKNEARNHRARLQQLHDYMYQAWETGAYKSWTKPNGKPWTTTDMQQSMDRIDLSIRRDDHVLAGEPPYRAFFQQAYEAAKEGAPLPDYQPQTSQTPSLSDVTSPQEVEELVRQRRVPPTAFVGPPAPGEPEVEFPDQVDWDREHEREMDGKLPPGGVQDWAQMPESERKGYAGFVDPNAALGLLQNQVAYSGLQREETRAEARKRIAKSLLLADESLSRIKRLDGQIREVSRERVPTALAGAIRSFAEGNIPLRFQSETPSRQIFYTTMANAFGYQAAIGAKKVVEGKLKLGAGPSMGLGMMMEAVGDHVRMALQTPAVLQDALSQGALPEGFKEEDSLPVKFLREYASQVPEEEMRRLVGQAGGKLPPYVVALKALPEALRGVSMFGGKVSRIVGQAPYRTQFVDAMTMVRQQIASMVVADRMRKYVERSKAGEAVGPAPTLEGVEGEIEAGGLGPVVKGMEGDEEFRKLVEKGLGTPDPSIPAWLRVMTLLGMGDDSTQRFIASEAMGPPYTKRYGPMAKALDFMLQDGEITPQEEQKIRDLAFQIRGMDEQQRARELPGHPKPMPPVKDLGPQGPPPWEREEGQIKVIEPPKEPDQGEEFPRYWQEWKPPQ